MKPLDDQSHYEVLEVFPGACIEEINRAYQLTRAAYQDDSLALYSVFGSEDAEAIRNRIDEAYRVLADPTQRLAYDQGCGLEASAAESWSTTEELAQEGADRDSIANLGAPAELPTAIDIFEDLDAAVSEEEQELDGAALRRARLRRGIELQQISEVTKVSNTYLECIEAERFEELPASVYIRGFVTAYARAIGLDPNRVASSYMERVDAARGRRKRGGLLGRS